MARQIGSNAYEEAVASRNRTLLDVLAGARMLKFYDSGKAPKPARDG